MKWRLLFITSSLLALWSCGENSFLLGSVDEPVQVDVRSVSAGQLLGPGAEIPLLIVRDSLNPGDAGSPDRLLVELLDHEGTLLAEQVYDSVDQATELPPLELPVLAEGLYQLRTRYYDGDELISEQTVPFFIAAGSYRILGVTSYPASSHPEADGLLRLSLGIPPGSDPFLVWRIDDAIVASGYLSETGTTIAVLAPAVPGVFPVRVDLYPVWPAGADHRTVPAPVTYAAELYVSTTPSPARTDLTPEESYFALYHFRGSLRDDGARREWFPSRSFRAEPFGAPELTVRSDVFGYALDGSSGFRMSGVVWPAYGSELSPVSISFRLLPDALVPDAVLMTTSLRSAEIAALLVDERGRIGFRYGRSDEIIWSALPMVRIGEPETITVSVVPGGEISFYTSGQLVSSVDGPGIALSAFDSPRLTAGADRWSILDGTTEIGAETGGFVGVIDEFGVFFRDADYRPATNTALFRDSMRFTYGSRLAFAASFEDPADAGGIERRGSVRVVDTALVMGSGSHVIFPGFEFEDEDLLVRLEASVARDATIRLLDLQSDTVIAELSMPETQGVRLVELRLTHRDEELSIVFGDSEPLTLRVGASFTGVRLALATGESERDEAAVRIATLVAVRDRPRIPAQLFQVSGE